MMILEDFFPINIYFPYAFTYSESGNVKASDAYVKLMKSEITYCQRITKTKIFIFNQWNNRMSNWN